MVIFHARKQSSIQEELSSPLCLPDIKRWRRTWVQDQVKTFFYHVLFKECLPDLSSWEMWRGICKPFKLCPWLSCEKQAGRWGISQLKGQQSLLTQPTSKAMAGTAASFRLSHAFIKHKKPIQDGQMVKDCARHTWKIMDWDIWHDGI